MKKQKKGFLFGRKKAKNDEEDDFIGTIIVPDHLYDEWVNASNWATASKYIIKSSSYFAKNIIQK